MPAPRDQYRPAQSRELDRRLRARARRARILRRRVGALTLALLLAFWGAIYTVGYLGSAGAQASVTLVAAATTSSSHEESAVKTSDTAASTGKRDSGSSGSGDSVSSKASTSSSERSTSDVASAVTTAQS